MKRRNATRSALFTSIISLLLCVSMLVGTTFAWFTDSVVSGTNVIAAGNLDVEVFNALGIDESKKVTTNTQLFDEITYWEPGVVAFENITVANMGSLALKYQLSVNFDNATENANGDTLAKVLKVGFVEGGISGYSDDNAGRTALVNKLTSENAWQALESFVQPGALDAVNKDLTAANTSDTYGIVIYWEPSTIDNEFNMNNENKGKVMSINLGIALVATQLEAELDSFGPDYDLNAPYSVWDGTVPTEMPETLVVDGDTQTIHVKDAAGLVYLSTLSDNWANLYTDGNGRDYPNYENGAGANYYYSNQWTISLDADIDLNNHSIEPIRIKIGEATGASTFMGNNHVIRNINTTTGLFADNNRATYADLTLVNVKATNGALTGTANTGINNVTVKNASIAGGDYVGGLVGYSYSGVSNCKVLDSNVTATGKEAGGLIGYIATSNESTEVVNNEVNNVTVFAGNRAAGLVAQVNEKVKVYNNVIDTVTVGAEDTSKYQPDAVVSNALVPENVYNNTVINANVLGGLESVAEGVYKDGNTYYVESAKGLSYFSAKALTGNNGTAEAVTIELNADIDMAGAEFSAIVAQYGDTLTFNGNGHTISNVKLVSGVNDNGMEQASMFFVSTNGGLTVSDLTLKDITVTTQNIDNGYAAAVVGYCEGALVLNNVDVVNANITGSKSSGMLVGHLTPAGTLNAANCDVDGTITISDYEASGHYAGEYVGTIAGNTALTKCTAKVTLGGKLHANNVGGIFGRKVSGNLTIDGAECVADGLTKNGVVYFVYNANGLETLNKKMADQSAGRDVVVNLTADIDFAGKTWTTVDSFADTAFEIAEINGNGHTISNLTINGQAMFRRFAGSGNVVIKDITFDKATVNSNGNINTSILTVQSYQNVLLDNVDVKNSSITGGYKVAPLIATVYNESSSTITATLKNCDVENVEVTATSYDFCTTGMVAFVNAGDNDQIEFENCTVTNVKLYAPNVYTAHAAVYTTGSETLFNEVEGVTVTNVTFENK